MKPAFLLTSVAIALMTLGGCVTSTSTGFKAGESLRMEEGVARVGANGRLETLDDNGVIAFALTNAGLMAGARIDGTRISKDPS